MNVSKTFRRRLRHRAEGLDIAADVNATVAANVGERNSRTVTRVTSRQGVVQRSPDESSVGKRPKEE